MVFRALNAAETVLAFGLVIAVALGDPPVQVAVALAIVILVLAVQLGAIS
ncbi:MAG: hypothetical protein ACRDQF_00095 [Thermocrispum sp.]